MMIPSQPAAQSCSTDAVTCSDTWPWSTYITFTPSASAALSITFLHWLPSTSVELQIDTPIVMSSSADTLIAVAVPSDATIAADRTAAAIFFILFFMF